MSIIALSSRILRLRNISNIRFGYHERPELRFKKSGSLVGKRYEEEEEEKDERIDESIGPAGYALLSVPIITFILGSWQVERRKWKLDLIEDLQKRVSAPPKPLPEDLTELEKMEYCPVKVKGHYLYDKEFAVGPKSLITEGSGASEKGGAIFSGGGNTGYYIITPFKLEDRPMTILVNRGWVRYKPALLPKEKKGHVEGTMEITGIIRLNEIRQSFMPKNMPASGLWFNRDLQAMAETVDADPVFIDLVASDSVPNGPIAGQTRITLRNEHLSYIFTWYTLSALTTWIWHRLFIRKLPLL